MQSVEELFVSLEDVTMWKELGQQFKITQAKLNQIQNSSIGVKEKTKNVLRYLCAIMHIIDVCRVTNPPT